MWLFLMIGMALAGDSDNTFRSITVGFEVTKPASWQFLTAKQNLENLKRTKLSDEEFHEMMLKYATAPLVAMMKYPEPFDDLNPSLKVNVRPFGQLKGIDPKQILSMVSVQFANIFKVLAGFLSFSLLAIQVTERKIGQNKIGVDKQHFP